MEQYVERAVEGRLVEALADTPVVVLNGPRQAGKSTLLARLAARRPHTALVTLDVAVERTAAQADPEGYVLDLHERLNAETVGIDEVQLAPELFRAIKLAVDRDRRPGRFILTGSTRLLSLPTLSDSLAGRMEVIELWPFSQGELSGRGNRFLDTAFAGEARVSKTVDSRRRIIDRAAAGGFPPALQRMATRRRAWATNYVQAVIDRDLAAVAALDRLAEMPRLLSLVAARTGGLINVSDLARDAAIPVRTVGNYLTWLERVFLVHRLPAWSSNRTTRARKAPKIHVADSGVLAALLDIGADTIDPATLGALLECFVAGELRRQRAWSDTDVELFHFRNPKGAEVDIVAEDRRGRIVGIEVKASVGIDERAFRGLRYLQERHPDGFIAGYVLYCGTETVPVGAGLHAVPIPALWAG